MTSRIRSLVTKLRETSSRISRLSSRSDLLFIGLAHPQDVDDVGEGRIAGDGRWLPRALEGQRGWREDQHAAPAVHADQGAVPGLDHVAGAERDRRRILP